MSIAPQVDVPILGRILQARPQEPPEVYSNLLPPSVGDSTAGSFPIGKRLAKLCATATGGIHPPLGKRVSAPQVDVPILGWNNAGTSAGATGGILKPTPAVEAIAPQVVF